MSELITTMQLRERLGVSKSQAYKLVRMPDFYPAVRNKNGVLIDCDKLTQWMKEKAEKKECVIRPIQHPRLSLCWECANACGGCGWSAEFIPIPGWDAEMRPVNIFGGKQIESYFVIGCPEFKEEERR